MTPDKALELVGRYSRLTKEIKFLKQQISEYLDKCPGVNGDRLAVDVHGCPTYSPEMDSKNRDKGLHLWQWYQPEILEDCSYYGSHMVWTDVGVMESEECPHCYAAHQVIQRRKQARKELGIVKGVMARSTK